MPEDIEACVALVKKRPGVENPYALCNFLKAHGRLPAKEEDLNAAVKDFLAAEPGHEHAAAEIAEVEETEDAWVLRNTVVAVPGVFNRKLRTSEELAKTAALWNGVPLIHRHPGGDVVAPGDLASVGGVLEAARFDAGRNGKGALVGTYRLLKRPVAGMPLTAEAAAMNRAWVEAHRGGRPVGVSIGYLHGVTREPGTFDGQAYAMHATHIVPDHLALYLDGTATACKPSVCGPSAGQNENEESFKPNRGASHSMAECGQECKSKHDTALERATKAETGLKEAQVALARIADAAGAQAGGEAKPGDIASAAVKALGEGREAKAKLEPLQKAEERRHARLLKDVIDAELPIAKEAAGREANVDDLRKQLEAEFKPWASEQLERHHATLQRATLASLAQPLKGGSRDGTKFGGREADGQLGVATAAKVWPRKEVKA